MSSDEEPINNDTVISDLESEHNEPLEVGDDLQGNEENTEEVQRDGTADGEGEENKDEAEKVAVKPKRAVRNPQPKLNVETLKGPRGIAALESYFERVKFKGKGHEHQDLNVIMKTYEYWCHRLFPKFPFDTCIERLEKLGTKKAVQTHIKRIRFDLLIEDKPIIDSSDEETNVEGFVDIENDKINQQNQQFDQLLGTSAPPIAQTPIELTVEQLERIRLNKERAEKLRQERLRKIQDKAEVNLEVSSQLPGTSGIENEAAEELFDTQSTQGDIINPGDKSNVLEGTTFDLESNVKGKAALRGSTVKKKSSKTMDVHTNGIETNSHDKLKKNNRLFASDDDEEDSIVSEIASI